MGNSPDVIGVRLQEAHVWIGISPSVLFPIVTGHTVWAEPPFIENKRAICKWRRQPVRVNCISYNIELTYLVSLYHAIPVFDRSNASIQQYSYTSWTPLTMFSRQQTFTIALELKPLSRLPHGGEAKTILKRRIDLEAKQPLAQKKSQQNALSRGSLQGASRRDKPSRRLIVPIWVRSSPPQKPSSSTWGCFLFTYPLASTITIMIRIEKSEACNFGFFDSMFIAKHFAIPRARLVAKWLRLAPVAE